MINPGDRQSAGSTGVRALMTDLNRRGFFALLTAPLFAPLAVFQWRREQRTMLTAEDCQWVNYRPLTGYDNMWARCSLDGSTPTVYSPKWQARLDELNRERERT